MEECGIESLCMILNIIRHNFHMDNIIVCKVVVFFPLRNDIFIFDNLQVTLEHLFPTVMSSIQNFLKERKENSKMRIERKQTEVEKSMSTDVRLFLGFYL